MANRQVWILNHYAQEPGSAGATRHFHLAEHLARNGWAASIVAASSEHLSGRQRLQDGESRRLESLGGVPFLWLRTPRYRGNGGGRMLNMLAYSLQAIVPWSTASLPRPDVVVGSSVHPFAGVAAWLLARRFGVPFVFEVRDLWPQTLVDLGRLKEGSPMTRALRLLERWLYRRADRIVVLLPRAADYICPLGIAPEKVVWVPNGVDLRLFPRPPDPVEPDPAAQTPFELMYFGAHGQANGLDQVLFAMKFVQDAVGERAIRLRMIGDGPLKPALKEQAEQLGLRCVQFEDPVSKNHIPALAASADAFVLSVLDVPLYRFGISFNKLYDFLASARPIVYNGNTANNPVRDAGAGLVVPPASPLAMADAIIRLMKMPLAERMAMGAAGRRHVEQNHGYDALAARFARVLNEAVGAIDQTVCGDEAIKAVKLGRQEGI